MAVHLRLICPLYQQIQGPDISRKKDAFRIIGLGDSITFGSFVNIEDTYLYKLESMLNLSKQSQKFEVVNAGVPGYGTIHELIYLKEKLFKYSPDLLIIGFCKIERTSSADYPNEPSP